MENIISILKSLNKKTRNATSRIKNIDDYCDFIKKIADDESTHNTVFIIELNKLPSDFKHILRKHLIKYSIKYSEYVILLNKDNYFYYNLNDLDNLNILNIKKFLELEMKVQDTCIVCLENSIELVSCQKCAASICRICEQKLDKCPICKKPHILVKRI
jgi:hypothetical protein